MIVVSVNENGPADKAGINDVIKEQTLNVTLGSAYGFNESHMDKRKKE